MRALTVAILLAAPLALSEPAFTLAVLDPQISGLSSEQAQVLADAVRDTVVASGKYRVQDRAAMREILAQQKQNASDACDESCAVEQGRLLQVRFLVTSVVRKVDGTTWLSVRLTDVESGQVVGTARDSCDCDLKALVPKAEDLTRTMLGAEKPSIAAPRAAARAEEGRKIRVEVIDDGDTFDVVTVKNRDGVHKCEGGVRYSIACSLTLNPGPAEVT